jgi:hypothetical protein
VTIEMMRPKHSEHELYTIGEQKEELLFQLANDDGQDEAYTEALMTSLEALDWDIDERVNSLLAVYRNCKAFEESAKAEKDRLARLQKGAQMQAERIRGAIKSVMERDGRRSMKLLNGTLSIPEKGAESVEILDLSLLPEGTYNIPTDIIPDKNEIKRRLKAGEEVPGAQLVRGEPALTIR